MNKIVMVKKRLSSGEPCRKCGQAEETLRKRGLLEKIDEIIWAVENDPNSVGMRLAREHGVDLAPFFLIHSGSGPVQVHVSTIKFAKALAALNCNEKTSNDSIEVASGNGPDSKAVQDAVLRLEESEPQESLDWALSAYGVDCALAFSGAEDVVLIDMAKASGKPFSVFCLDTGRLHPETYQFIERVRTHYEVEIQVTTPHAPDVEVLVREKGLFSFLEDGHRECCGIRKVAPLRKKLSAFQAWATGQRKDQSPTTRGSIPVLAVDTAFVGKSGPLIKINPLANWSSKQVWNYIRKNDVPYSELHDSGFHSIGCEPCTRAARPGEHERAARWWWELETQRECGLHKA